MLRLFHQHIRVVSRKSFPLFLSTRYYTNETQQIEDSKKTLMRLIKAEKFVSLQKYMHELDSKDQLFTEENLKTLIDGFAFIGRTDMASRFFNKLVEKFGEPKDFSIYESVIEGYLNERNLEAATEWLNHLQLNQKRPSKELMDLYIAETKREIKLEEIREEYNLDGGPGFRNAGETMHIQDLNYRINRFLKGDESKSCLEDLYYIMENVQEGRVENADITTFKLLTDAALKQGDTARVVDFIDIMFQEYDLEMDEEFLNKIIKGFESSDGIGVVRDLHKILQQNGVKIPKEFHEMALKVAENHRKWLDSFVEEYKQ